MDPLLVKVAEANRHRLGEEHRYTLESINELIELYEAWGKPEKAKEWRAKLPRKKGTEKK